MKIVVLCGGLSTERNVSLVSGTMVCQALRERGHQAVLVDLFLGREAIEEQDEDLFAHLPALRPVSVEHAEPDLQKVRHSRRDKSPALFGPGVIDLCSRADVVFLALHGECGEDGRVQAAFDLLGIHYTGSGYRGSAVAMDKELTKVILKANGILTPRWRSFTYTEGEIPALAADMHLPCVVKIPRGGSSIGVSIVHTRDEAEKALRDDLKYDNTVIVEEYIKGGEFTCAVLDDRALPSVEIVPKAGFYDYANKYQAGATEEICPGRVSPETEKKMGDAALAVHKALGLTAYSRSDFMIDEREQVYCLEVNTLPGMTPTSLVPQEALAVGLSYGELCEKIIEVSLRASRWGE